MHSGTIGSIGAALEDGLCFLKEACWSENTIYVQAIIYIYIYLYVDSQRAAELKHPKLMKILICYVFALPRAAQVRWKQFGDCCRASQSNQGSTEIAIGWSFIWRGSMRIVAWYWSYIAMSVRKTNKNICIIYIVLPPPHLRWIWISSGTHMRHLAILGDTRVLA